MEPHGAVTPSHHTSRDPLPVMYASSASLRPCTAEARQVAVSSSSAADTMVPEVHLVGSDSSTCNSLAQAILAHSSQAADTSDGPHQWLIDNKYYTAQTLLRVLHADGEPTGGDGSRAAPEAIVLVVDATQQDSFTSVQSWAKTNPNDEAGVRLLVAAHSDALLTAGAAADQTQAEPTRPAWLQACRDWCTDALYEYIEVCCTNADLDKQLRLDGEEQGLSRVVAALHAHMWPGLARKHKEPAQPVDTSTPEAASNDVDTSQHVHVQISSAAASKPKASSAQFPNAAAAVGGTGSDTEHEAALDMYEALMDELEGMKQELSRCDDDTRRTRAAEMALRFAALLGEDEDSDDIPSDSSDAICDVKR